MTWMQTYTGKRFDFINVDVDNIDIVDIAHSLAYSCRYGGHCKEFYSIAQHSVICSAYVPQEYQFEALMHDAAEAYIGDIVSPLKGQLRNLPAIERVIEQSIANKFGLIYPFPPVILKVDRQLALAERKFLFNDLIPWDIHEDPLDLPKLAPWHPIQAESTFMQAFDFFNKEK